MCSCSVSVVIVKMQAIKNFLDIREQRLTNVKHKLSQKWFRKALKSRLLECKFAKFFQGMPLKPLWIIVSLALAKRKYSGRLFLRPPQKFLHTPLPPTLVLRQDLANHFYYLYCKPVKALLYEIWHLARGICRLINAFLIF